MPRPRDALLVPCCLLGDQVDPRLAATLVVPLSNDLYIRNVDHELNIRRLEGLQRSGHHEGVDERARKVVSSSCHHHHMRSQGLLVPVHGVCGQYLLRGVKQFLLGGRCGPEPSLVDQIILPLRHRRDCGHSVRPKIPSLRSHDAAQLLR